MTGVSSSCGACKFLRRKCTSECVFAPNFSYDGAVAHFGAVHKVFGASNVSRLLLHLPEQFRGEAALTISFEALARMRDPVYGCVAYIYALQREVANLQEEIEVLGNDMANNLSIGLASRDYQVTNSSNLLIYDSLLYPKISSQEDEMTNNNQLEFWMNSSINYQVEPITLPTYDHAENGSCNSSQMNLCNHMMMNLPVSLCECEGQNLFGITDSTWTGPQECFVQELLNQETYFDNSSLFGWLPQYASTSN